MKVRAVLVAGAIAAALTACSSGGTSGHLVPSSGASSGGGGAAASTGAGVVVSTGSSGSSSAPVVNAGGVAGFCANLAKAQTQLGALSGASSDPSKAGPIFDQQIQAFKGLQKGAPADVAPAIGDLIKVLTAAKGFVTDPAHADPSALQGLSTNLPKDAATIGAYVGSKCAGG